MKHYDNYDYKQCRNKPRRVRHHEPIYLLCEIADMFHIDLHQLRQKMSVAARKHLPHPQPISGIKGGTGWGVRLNYYSKQDFANFLNKSA